MLGRHRDISAVKERVKLLGQQHAVLDMITRRTKVWLNMCSIEYRLSVFASDRALTTVCIKQAKAKAPLTFAHCLRALITPNF